MRASTKRILSIGISGILFIAALVVYANLIRPATVLVGQKRSELYSKESAFENQKLAVQKVKELISKLQGVAELQRTVSLVMPSRPDITQVLNQLQAITNTYQTNLKSFTIRTLPFEGNSKALVKRIGTLELDVTVTGSYDSVKNFLRAMEANVRVFNVKRFRVSPAGGSQGGVQDFFTAQVTFQAYYQE